MGLTAEGFQRRTYDDILNDKIDKAVELFGSDIDTSDLTPLGKYIRLNAYDQALAEEEAEAIYYSIFPEFATGDSLSRLCPFVGISRMQAIPATYTVKVTGETGTEIPYGWLVRTEAVTEDVLTTYYNTQEAVIGADGTCTLTVECVEAGTIGNVDPAEICEAVNPTAGVTSVAGVGLVTIGADVEDDVSLRNRFEQAREGMGSCNEDAIRAALLRVPTVTSAGVIVNEGDTTDADGRPARSFECFIAGGENYHAEIAETIFEKKPIGIRTWGDVSQEVTDASGNAHAIRFSHTSQVSVYVRMSIRTDATFEGEDGVASIKNRIMAHINSLSIGQPVIISPLYGIIHDEAGVIEVTSLELSKDGASWSSANIAVERWEKALCSSVSVTEVS